jgi:DNA processing protein
MTGQAEGACFACLRRGELLARLGPRIADLFRTPSRRPQGVLALSDQDLIAALAGERAEAVQAWLDELDPTAVRGAVEKSGLECVCRHSDLYPPALLDLPDPPAALYVAGGVERLSRLALEPSATVVGGRSATPYGLEVAAVLGRGLGAAGITVVSGLALGVDGAVHRGAMRGGDGAVAVLACGADVPYPRAHRGLYDCIRSRGVVVSELPPGTPPMRWSFPARNRIMAALGQITVVVEARERSGSLITVGFAEALGRAVGGVPGRVTSERAAGSNRLLRDGACVIRGPEDLLDELFGVGGGSIDSSGVEAARTRALAEMARPGVTPSDLEPTLRSVLGAVEAGHRLDAIGNEAGLGPGQVRAALGRLELMGLVSRDGLGLYERTAEHRG